MSPVAVGLVLAGSLAHATWNVLVKRSPDSGPVLVWAYSMVSLVLLGPVAVVVAARTGVPGAGVLGASAVSAVLHLVYSLALQRAYGRSDMNVAYPVARGVGPVLVVAFAVVVLGERLSGPALVGVAAVLAGVVIVSTCGPGSTERSGPVEDAAPGVPDARGSGALHGVGVGAAIAAYTLWDDHAVNGLGADPVPYYLGTAALQCVLLTAVCWRRRAQVLDVVRRGRRTTVAVALLVPTSYLLVLLAMERAPVAVVAPLRSTSIVLASLAGWLLLGERSGARRLVGAVVVLAGVAALVTG